jgi:hypothetical protein
MTIDWRRDGCLIGIGEYQTYFKIIKDIRGLFEGDVMPKKLKDYLDKKEKDANKIMERVG